MSSEDSDQESAKPDPGEDAEEEATEEGQEETGLDEIADSISEAGDVAPADFDPFADPDEGYSKLEVEEAPQVSAPCVPKTVEPPAAKPSPASKATKAKSAWLSALKAKAAARAAAETAMKAAAKRAAPTGAKAVTRSKIESVSLVLAALLGASLVGGMVALWQMFGGGEEELPQGALFLAQFHPIFVHLPITLLVVVFLMEVLSIVPIWRNLGQNTLFLLWLAALGSGAAIVAGYLLKATGEYSGPRVESHMWLGLIVAVGSWAVLTLKSAGAAGSAYRVILALTVFVLGLAGHLGGTITHGPDYLVKDMPEPYRSWPIFDDGRFLSLFGAISGEGEGRVTGRLYDDYVARVLEEKCTSCHGADKQKGKLRLDSHESILKGAEGSDFPNVVIGKPEESEMLARVHLPMDDDDHMPPEEEPQLTAEEVELLEWWIGKGKASEVLMVADIAIDMELAGILKRMGPPRIVEKKMGVDEKEDSGSEPVRLPANERETVLKGIREKGFAVRAVSAEDEGLQFNAINVADEFDDAALALFEPVAGSFVELRLGRTKITDKSGALLGKMGSLVTLHLEKTGITDASVAEMTGLDQLEYLNLYGTKVTDEAIEDLLMLEGLKTVYLWQTAVTEEGAAKLRAGRRGLTVDMGRAEKSAVEKTAE